MAKLLCDQHGKDYADSAKHNPRDFYEGENLIITTGFLVRGGLQCDKCPVSLNEKHKAYLVCSYPAEYIGDFFEYDFRDEEEYFGVIEFNKDNTEMFGYDALGEIPPPEFAAGAFKEDK